MTFIIIPTYNEKDNIEDLIKQIDGNFQIVIVDDNSPDQTAATVKKLSESRGNIHLIRGTRKGYGAAIIKGFKYAVKNNARFIIQMDADLSHDPKEIDLFLKTAQDADADLVIGSRMIKSGSQERSLYRKIVTKSANKLINILFDLQIKDSTSGFRCYKSDFFQYINPDKLTANGPELLVEILYYAKKQNLKIKEIPINFKDRTKGYPKNNIITFAKVFLFLLKLRVFSKSFTE